MNFQFADKTVDGASDKLKLHPDVREFAVAVADFALLYDPRERTAVGDRHQQ